MRAAEWIGGVGETWASEWQRTDRSFAGLDAALERAILMTAPVAGGRWVDLGCGAGKTSIAIADARPDAEVIGLDLSPDLIAVAAGRAEGSATCNHCRFVAGDAAERLAIIAPVDFFFSRHGVMFFDDPVAAFGQIALAAAPGARLVFSCFAAPGDNPWATETLAAVTPMAVGAPPVPPVTPPPGPFAFADPARVRAILSATGWVAAHAPERAAFSYVAGGGDDPAADAVSFFRRIGPAAAALAAATDGERPALLDRLAAACERRRVGDEVAFPAAAWLWSAQLRSLPDDRRPPPRKLALAAHPVAAGRAGPAL